jgi:hypothetical protein
MFYIVLILELITALSGIFYFYYIIYVSYKYCFISLTNKGKKFTIDEILKNGEI